MAAAAKEFASGGFARTSLRQIARSAGVDPALVHHYFRNKEDLFLASLALPVNPVEILRASLPDPTEVESFGTELLRVVVPIWDRPEVSARLTAIVRSILDDSGVSSMMEEFVRDRLFALIVEGLDLDTARRDALFVRFHAFMVGILVDRYLVRPHGLTAMSAAEVAETFGPMLDSAFASALGPRPNGHGSARARADGDPQSVAGEETEPPTIDIASVREDYSSHDE